MLAVNHSVGLSGLISLKPPSPAFTFSQLVLLCDVLVAGDPLSSAPPRIVFGSLGCWEKETNWVIEPSVSFKLSNWLLPPQVPVVRPV